MNRSSLWETQEKTKIEKRKQFHERTQMVRSLYVGVDLRE